MASTGRGRVSEGFVSLRLPAKLKVELEKLAEKDRRTLSDYLRLALEEHVARKRK